MSLALLGDTSLPWSYEMFPIHPEDEYLLSDWTSICENTAFKVVLCFLTHFLGWICISNKRSTKWCRRPVSPVCERLGFLGCRQRRGIRDTMLFPGFCAALRTPQWKGALSNHICFVLHRAFFFQYQWPDSGTAARQGLLHWKHRKQLIFKIWNSICHVQLLCNYDFFCFLEKGYYKSHLI